MTEPKKRRRIMRAFKINELSCVDSPAQRHAQMTIMKRHDAEEVEQDMRIEKITGRGRITLFTRHGDEEHDRIEKITRDDPVSFANLEDAIEALQNIHKCGRTQAMEKAARSHPQLVARYNEEGLRIAKAAQEAAAPRPVAEAIRDFNQLVSEVQSRDKLPRHEAMEKAAREFPEEFEAYQSGGD